MMWPTRDELFGTVIVTHLFIQLIASQTCQEGFSPYPTCAIQYLCDAVPSECKNLADASATDECLCSNTNFMTNSALGIFANCGCTDLTTTATLRVTICNEYAPDVPVTVEQYIAVGDGGQSVCGPSSTITTSSSTSFSSASSIISMTTTSTEVATPTPMTTSITSSLLSSQSTPAASSSSSSSSTASNSSEHGGGGEDGLSSGATAAITIGSFVAVLITTALALDKWFQKKRHLRLLQVLCGVRRKGSDGIGL